MMDELIEQLHAGNYSCVIAGNSGVRAFTQRGVADLYDLLTKEPEYLKGAMVADKVVGKGAAALMALGKIKELYADVISTKALILLQKHGISVRFMQEVPFIWNRNHTGYCPVETLCDKEDSLENMLLLIHNFMNYNIKTEYG